MNVISPRLVLSLFLILFTSRLSLAIDVDDHTKPPYSVIFMDGWTGTDLIWKTEN